MQLNRIGQVRTCMKESYRVYSDGDDDSVRINGTYDGQVSIRQTTNGTVVVAFRGTESWKDWMINLLRTRSQFPMIPGAMVHTGFQLQHDALFDKIVAQLMLYHTLVPGILVTGHSLGGALATLFAATIARRMSTVNVVCFVFGSPRVGNRKFVKGLKRIQNLSIVRINSAYDIIPCVPWMGYTHTAEVLTLSVKNTRWYQVRKRHSIRCMYETFVGEHGSKL